MKEDYKDIFKKHFNEHLEDVDAEEMYAAIKVRKKRRGPRRKKNKLLIVVVPFLLGAAFLISSAVKNWQDKKSEKTALESNSNGQAMNDIHVSPQNPSSDDQSVNFTKPDESENISTNENNADEDLTKVIKQLNDVKSNATNQKLVDLDISISESANNSASANDQKSIAINDNDAEINTSDPDEKRIDNLELVMPMTGDKQKLIVQGVDELESENELSPRIEDVALLSAIDASVSYLSKKPRPLLNTAVNVEQKAKETFNRWGIQAGSSVGLFSTNYKYGDISFENYAANRDLTESALEAISGHVLVDYQFHKNISISSGLAYTRINELFEWEGASLQQRSGQHITGVEQYPDGQENLVYSNGTYEALVDRKLKVYNKTDLIYVPVYLNTHHELGDISLNFMAGVKANVVVNEEGYILNQNFVDEPLSQENESIFKLGWSGGVGLEYTLRENLGLNLNAKYTYWTKDQSGISISYHIIESGLSLKYQF